MIDEMAGATAPGGDEAAGYPVLVIDDHELFSAALALALRERGLAAQRARVTSVEGILGQARQSRAGLVVLDVDVATAAGRGKSLGGDLVRGLRELGWQVLIVTGTRDEPAVAEAIAAGALGALPKTSSFDALVHAVFSAVRAVPLMDEDERRRWLVLHDGYQTEKRRLAERLAALSPREREILALLTHGYRASAIAETFIESLPDARGEIQGILVKLGVASQLEAVALAARAEMHLAE